jgi:hypothetical protein
MITGDEEVCDAQSHFDGSGQRAGRRHGHGRVSAAVATDATAGTGSGQVSTPQLDLTGIENQLAFLVQELLNTRSNNLVQCILSGFTSPACGHNPV